MEYSVQGTECTHARARHTRTTCTASPLLCAYLQQGVYSSQPSISTAEFSVHPARADVHLGKSSCESLSRLIASLTLTHPLPV